MTAEAVEKAAHRISKWVRKTPTIRMKGPGARTVILKRVLQRSGSFKLRGALNKS